MICNLCATAADRQAPAAQHCGDDKCMCGHLVERYGKTTTRQPADSGQPAHLGTGWDALRGFQNATTDDPARPDAQ